MDSHLPSRLICRLSTPLLAKMLAKVRRKVCGLQGRPVLAASLSSMYLIPQKCTSHSRPLARCSDNHCFNSCSVRSPKRASPSRFPLQVTLITRRCQSMSSGSMLASSDSRSPVSANRDTIALSLILLACSISKSTCSTVRLGSILFSTFGGSTHVIGLR